MSDGTLVSRPTASPSLPQIPGCKLISIAGQGGMGTVYRAEQLSPRRTVAVKVLTRSSGSPETLAAFKRVRAHYRAIQAVAGALLVAMGGLLLSGYLYLLNVYAQRALRAFGLDWWTSL